MITCCFIICVWDFLDSAPRFDESLSDERDQYSSHTVQIKNNPFFLGIPALCFLQPYNNSWFVIHLRSARNKLSSIVFLSTEVYRMLASYKEELNFGSRRTSFNFRLKSGIGLLDLLKSRCFISLCAIFWCYQTLAPSEVFHWAKKMKHRDLSKSKDET